MNSRWSRSANRPSKLSGMARSSMDSERFASRPHTAPLVSLGAAGGGGSPPRAQAILGNHDLNILLDRQREGNDWFFAEGAEQRRRVKEFFRTLPLVLDRPDLRVVHACWDGEMIDL